MKHSTEFLFCFLVLGLFLSLSCAQETAEKQTEDDLISERGRKMNLKADKVKESTVHLSGFGVGGTGFFVAPDKIATNFHVIEKYTTGPITAKLGHKETIWPVEGVVAFDIEYDIAILKVKGKGISLPLGDNDTLQIGEFISVVGFPAPENRYKVTKGVVEKIRNSDKRFPNNSGSLSREQWQSCAKQ